ncbi:MAG: TspO/MBR family protein [Syntrophobacteraceae bacterium]
MVKAKNALGLVGWLAVSFSAALIGSRYVPGEWYASLAKPSWNPPNAVFGPVWSVLYALMGVSAWLVWRRAGFTGAGRSVMGLFFVQLVLNALWSYLFFGLHRPDIAFFEIVVLWVAILVVVVLFWSVDRVAGVLMLPYLAWVGFASCLNFALWRLNVSPM